MKRKIISIMLTLTLIISAFAGIDSFAIVDESQSVNEWGDYEYAVNFKNEVIIKTYMGNDRVVTIPSEINGLPVTEIGDFSFNGSRRRVDSGTGFENHPNRNNNKWIRKVIIPPSVKTIGEYAFENLDWLREIVFSEGLETIKQFAFANCSRLEKIALPNSLINFELLAFEQTAIEEITLGSNVTSLNLSDVSGTSVKRIIANADKITLGTVTLRKDVSVLEEIICNGRFYSYGTNKGTLKRVVCNGEVDYEAVLSMKSRGFKYYSDSNGDNVIFSTETMDSPVTYETDGFRYYLNGNSEAVITRYKGGESVVNVPSSLGGHTVTAIAPLAFSSLETEYIKYPIANDYLIDKNLLISVTLPDTVKSIGKYAFAFNFSLEAVNIPAGVEKISEECFLNCKSLRNIVLPDGAKEICDRSFENCEALESIEVKGVSSIGYRAFYGCEALQSIEIKNVSKVGEFSFYRCTSLEEVVFSQKLKEIGADAFSGCKLTGTLDLSAVEKIGGCAFSGTQIKKVILNDNLEKLEYAVFESCTQLEEVNFPSKLVSIGDCCFRSTAICKAVFGENLREIGALAFEYCKELYIMELPDSIEKIGSYAFEHTLIELLVIPENLSVIGYGAFGNCKELETIYFNAKNCAVEQYGDEYTDLDYEDLKNASPFYGCRIKEIFLGEGITSIGGDSALCGTFEDCSELESVIIPDTVSEIGTSAFKNCSSLETAVVSGSVTKIAQDAFDGCKNLTILCFKDSYVYLYAKAQGIRVSTFVVAPIPNQTYTGYEIKPEVNVSFSGDTLNKNIDFGVTYANNINAGEADVTVKGKGDYKNFSNTVKFTIVTKSIVSATIAPIAEQQYTGSAVTPELIVTDGARLLSEGKDYTVSYSDNKREGTAKAKITGIGNYSGSMSAEFKIVRMSDGKSFFIKVIYEIKLFFVKIGSLLTGIFN
ncbi:MAG: leucine-rich repeat domain-containing protein [Acutalibacteraceae bacterium]